MANPKINQTTDCRERSTISSSCHAACLRKRQTAKGLLRRQSRQSRRLRTPGSGKAVGRTKACQTCESSEKEQRSRGEELCPEWLRSNISTASLLLPDISRRSKQDHHIQVIKQTDDCRKALHEGVGLLPGQLGNTYSIRPCEMLQHDAEARCFIFSMAATCP